MHIDFLVKDRKFYSQENYMAVHLLDAFNSIGVSARIVSLANEDFGDFFYEVQTNPPDATIAFEPLFMLDKPLCDTIGIPHVHWELRSLSRCMHLAHSCYGRVAFKERMPHMGITFLPHPVVIKENSSRYERPFDTVLFADLVDISRKMTVWKNLFSHREFLVIQKGVDLILGNKDLSAFEIAVSLHAEDPESINISDLIFCMEEYERAIQTRVLIESFEGNRLDVFGEHAGNNWIKRLKNNIFLHSSLPYTEHFEVLKMAKVLLCIQQDAKDGSDEWMLSAWEAGCFVLTNTNPYLKELVNEEDVLFYPIKDLGELQDKITYYLSETQKRMDLVEQLRSRVCHDHTFKKRAETLFNLMVT